MLKFMTCNARFSGTRIAFRTVVLGALFSAGSFAQQSHQRDPGIPVNYSPLSWFGSNLGRQQLFFHRLPGISPDYRLGGGDMITVEVVGHDVLKQQVKLSNSGEINLAPIGSIQAADLTASELESRICDLLKERQLILNPEVLVYVDWYEAKRIYVLGEVDNPGEYVMTQQLTLMDAIFVAGGLDFTADRYGYLHRRTSQEGPDWAKVLATGIGGRKQEGARSGKPAWLTSTSFDHPDVARPGTQVTKVDLQPLKGGGVLEPNILLRKGDVFIVPRRQVELFYVVGDVKGPGPYEIPPPPERAMLVSQAISQAGGPTKTAKMSKGLLVRYDKSGQRQEIKVDYSAVLRGSQQDFEIHANDIVFIPGSNAKTLAYGLLGIIPTTAQNAMIYYGDH